MRPDGEQDVEGLKVGLEHLVILCSWTLCASGLLLFTTANNWSRLFLCSGVNINNNYPAAKFDLTATLEKDSIIVKQL